jgi:hypothetical protein
VGAGDSGKSLYVRIISAILGDQLAAPTKFNMLDKQFQSAVLVGKRFLYDPDYDTGEVCGNNVIMCATGGDMLSIERKGKDPFSYRFRGLLCVCSNEMPRTRGNLTQAYYNRLIVCKCPNPVPKEKQDKHLLEKMLYGKNWKVAFLERYAQLLWVNGATMDKWPDMEDLTDDEIQALNELEIEFGHKSFKEINEDINRILKI